MLKKHGVDKCCICGFVPSYERRNGLPYCIIHFKRQVDIENGRTYVNKSNKSLDELRQAINTVARVPERSG